MLPKLSVDSIFIRITIVLFMGLGKNLETKWKHKISSENKGLLSSKINAGGITIPNLKLCCRAIVTKLCYDSKESKQANKQKADTQTNETKWRAWK